MKKTLLIMIILYTSAFAFWGKSSTITVNTIEGMDLYLDGKFITQTGRTNRIKVDKGTHTIKIHKVINEGITKRVYLKEEREIFIGKDMDITISLLNPIEETEPTKKKLYSNTSNAFEYKVGPIDFNLAEKNRFVTGRIGFSIPCESKRHFNELKALNPYIKDAVIRILSTKNIEECRDINKIKTELLAKINSFTRQGQANSLAILDFVIE